MKGVFKNLLYCRYELSSFLFTLFQSVLNNQWHNFKSIATSRPFPSNFGFNNCLFVCHTDTVQVMWRRSSLTGERRLQVPLRARTGTWIERPSWIASSYERIQSPCRFSNPQWWGASSSKFDLNHSATDAPKHPIKTLSLIISVNVLTIHLLREFR
jgi:hypothetical protein